MRVEGPIPHINGTQAFERRCQYKEHIIGALSGHWTGPKLNCGSHNSCILTNDLCPSSLLSLYPSSEKRVKRHLFHTDVAVQIDHVFSRCRTLEDIAVCCAGWLWRAEALPDLYRRGLSWRPQAPTFVARSFHGAAFYDQPSFLFSPLPPIVLTSLIRDEWYVRHMDVFYLCLLPGPWLDYEQFENTFYPVAFILQKRLPAENKLVQFWGRAVYTFRPPQVWNFDA